MKRFRHLVAIARDGFDDMAPALRRAFNDDPLDDNLRRVFGPRPRLAIAALTLGAIALGLAVERLVADSGPAALVNWPATAVCIGFALAIRRYLFTSHAASGDDFVWLVAPIIPATALLVLLSLGRAVAAGGFEIVDGGPAWTVIGGIATRLADACEVAAGVTIAVAALCYSRNWATALWQLAWRLLVLQIVLGVLLFILLEISLMERILSAIVDALFGFRLPGWIGEFVDQLTYAAILFALYFAIIGATWTVCRESFPQLLDEGSVDVIETVNRLVDPARERKIEKQQEKAARKAAKKAEKLARKARKGAGSRARDSGPPDERD